MFSLPFLKQFLWGNSLKPKGTHPFQLGSAQQEGMAVTQTACSCVCFPFSFSPLGHQSKVESIRVQSSLVGNYSPKTHCLCFNLLHPVFPHFPAPAPLPGSTLSSFFPVTRCPSIAGWYRWEECSHGGEQGPSLVLLCEDWPGAHRHCLCLPESAQAEVGLLSRCPNHPSSGCRAEQVLPTYV